MEMVLQQSGGAGVATCRPGPRALAVAPAAKQEVVEEQEAAAAEGDELRRGPWTVEEDVTLINYIADHGEGRWNALARAAGLKRTGKSCRLRWLNYLRPDVKRGDFTADEQLLILDLHSRWGNRWSKIAQQLPGRTDNEIKNYWRTRVQKHAKQLNCDVNSQRFRDAMTFLWMPRLAERAAAHSHGHHHGTAALTTSPASVVTSSASSTSSSSLTSSSSSESTPDDKTTASVVGDHVDYWAAALQGADHDLLWSSAPAAMMMHLHDDVVHDHDHDLQAADVPDLSGWVQGFSFSEGVSASDALWSLDDIWKMH